MNAVGGSVGWRAPGSPAALPDLHRAGEALVAGGRRLGAVAVGATVDEAVDRLELVEVLCRTWRDALLIRAAATGAERGAILRPPSLRPGTPVRGSTRRDR